MPLPELSTGHRPREPRAGARAILQNWGVGPSVPFEQSRNVCGWASPPPRFAGPDEGESERESGPVNVDFGTSQTELINSDAGLRDANVCKMQLFCPLRAMQLAGDVRARARWRDWRHADERRGTRNGHSGTHRPGMAESTSCCFRVCSMAIF